MDDELFELWADDSNWEERPGFFKPVDITIGGNTVTWMPDQEFLMPKSGDYAKELAESIRISIESMGDHRGRIETVPLASSLPATVANLYTVFWVLHQLYEPHEITFEGEIPKIEDIIGGPDGWNEDGTVFTIH